METFINSPPSKVWRIIEKHLEHPEVSPVEHDIGEIQEVRGEPLSEQRSGVGTRTRWFYNYKGRPFVWDDIVTDWERDRRVVWKATSAWEMEDSFTLQPQERGTRLTYDMNYRLPYGLLGKLYGKFILEPQMRKHLESVLRGMKMLCETPLQRSEEY